MKQIKTDTRPPLFISNEVNINRTILINNEPPKYWYYHKNGSTIRLYEGKLSFKERLFILFFGKIIIEVTNKSNIEFRFKRLKSLFRLR